MMNNLFREAELRVFDIFKTEGNPEYIYHDFNHTKDVVAASEKIGIGSGLSDEQMEILTLAAWFHDAGYTAKTTGHEEVSAGYAEAFLKEKNYPADKIKKVKSAILSTKMPQSPKNLLEEIICDADLHHLGSEDFFEKNVFFRIEMENRKGKKFSESEWYKLNSDFFASHKYFTKYAADNFDKTKNENFVKLEKMLKKHKKDEKELKRKSEKLELEKEKLKKKKNDDNNPARTVETMFRNVMRTHIDLSSMADNKANIMISVNTLLLTAIIAILSRKLDSNPHLIVPTVIMTSVSMITLIFATLVTRPKVTGGTFTDEDIEQKRANLLFFGNFYNMDLKKFQWGMTEMINDKSYLINSMIKDFYYLGQVLGKKYKYLRICYSIFMFGLIISVLAFGIAIYLYPETDLGIIP